MTIFYCLRFEIAPIWRIRFPYLYPRGTGWPSYTSRHWVRFPSPPTTRKATVEAFELASTRDTHLLSLHYIFSALHDTDRTETIGSNSYSVACVFFALGRCLPSRYLVTAVSSGSMVRLLGFRWERKDTQTHNQPGDHIGLLLFFQIKGNRLKIVKASR
jgi:hypothetical protein